MKYCSKCGSEFNAGSKFCDQCGHQPENLNKEDEGNAQAEITPVKVYEKTKKPVLSKSKIMKKIIAIALTLSTFTIALASFYFAIVANQSSQYNYKEADMEEYINELMYNSGEVSQNNPLLNVYSERLKYWFPTRNQGVSGEILLDDNEWQEIQVISDYLGTKRDENLKKIDELIEIHRDCIRDYKALSNDLRYEIGTLNEAIAFGLLPLSSIMFFMSLYLLVISFKETK